MPAGSKWPIKKLRTDFKLLDSRDKTRTETRRPDWLLGTKAELWFIRSGANGSHEVGGKNRPMSKHGNALT